MLPKEEEEETKEDNQDIYKTANKPKRDANILDEDDEEERFIRNLNNDFLEGQDTLSILSDATMIFHNPNT